MVLVQWCCVFLISCEHVDRSGGGRYADYANSIQMIPLLVRCYLGTLSSFPYLRYLTVEIR